MRARYRIVPATPGVPEVSVVADGLESAFDAAVRHLEHHKLLHRGVTPVVIANPDVPGSYAIAQPRLTRPVHVTITEESS